MIFSGCYMRGRSNDNRILVVQEVKLRDGYSMFWFRDESEITHHGLSYFQFTKDKCNLSVTKANASCDVVLQIYDVVRDTISLLVSTKINPIVSDEHFKFKQIDYSPGMYNKSKGPFIHEQYFLDSLCKKRSK